ncbi:MAG: transposase family protein, partial [Bifidobacteriaceae bacterium]|nr:transposase family protein [Bifidobacteriaceae bacterium]
RTNYSGKRHCQCLSIQVACDLNGTLIATSTPVPGARHDAAAIELTGWQHILHDANWVADSAYQATTAITPVRKPPGAELPEATKQFNKQIASIRCVVERCISHLKNRRIISRGHRRQLKRLPFTIALITKLELYRLGW